MEEQSEIVRSKKEFAFASSTILSQVGRGIIVGLIVGIIVGSFRLVGHSLEKICARYSCYCQWTHAGSRGTQYSTWSSWW